MGAEVLLDAISASDGGAHRLRRPAAPGTRAIELPDESVASNIFGYVRSSRSGTRPCECERVTDASLGQSLMLLNSNDVQAKLGASGDRQGRPRS